MSEDYLWDRSGPVDLDIARLERVLGRLRASDPPAPLRLPVIPPSEQTVPDASASRTPVSVRRFVLPFAVAATLAIAAGNVWLSWFWTATPRGSWQVSRLAGTPRVSSSAIGDAPAQWTVGDTLETDAQARARIRVPHVGRIDVEPGTRVGLLSTRTGDYRLRLDRGTLQALIWSAPGQFHVETPAATAVDLGCAYTLRVSENGDESIVQVTSGWVALDSDGSSGGSGGSRDNRADSSGAGRRSAFVRAGATGIARRGVGPGTPYANDVSPAVKDALRLIDFESATPETRTARAAALDRVLAEARANDALMLWHLLWLGRVEEADRDRVFDRLAAFAPPPPDVTRDGIRTGTDTTAMLNRWWTAARLGPPRHTR